MGFVTSRVQSSGARSGRWSAACVAGALAVIGSGGAHAERIENQIAVFSALDKVTARISKFEVALGATATFGALKVTPRACYSRPATEQPKTTTFVEVDEVQLDGSEKRVFTGWMFAESPGLYGVEHPTFDVWLTDCQKPTKATAQKSLSGEQTAAKPKVRDDAAAPQAGNGAASAEDGAAGATSETLPPIDGAAVETEQEFRRRVRR